MPALLALIYAPSCLIRDPDVVFYAHDGHTFARAEQRLIESIAGEAVQDARRVLPTLPRGVILRVNPGRRVIDEIGSSSSYSLPNVVHWMVDPTRTGGPAGIARQHLRAALFHQFYRITREAHLRPSTLMDHVVSSGLAVAFERDFGGREYPWAEYPPDVADWAKELRSLPPDANRNQWLFRHPDGRRWVGMRAGTYLVDRAMAASRKSAADLVLVPTEEILRLAEHEDPRR